LSGAPDESTVNLVKKKTDHIFIKEYINSLKITRYKRKFLINYMKEVREMNNIVDIDEGLLSKKFYDDVKKETERRMAGKREVFKAEGIAEGIAKGEAKGKVEGEAEGVRKSATKLLKKGLSVMEVADFLELSVDEVNSLNNSLSSH
jgi:predicted transposase/invertase (TIGR01784 family)